MPRRHVERVDERLEDAESQDLPDLDHPGEGQRREHPRLDHREDLSYQQDAVAIPAIDENPRQRGKDKRGDLASETQDPEEQRCSRSAGAANPGVEDVTRRRVGLVDDREQPVRVVAVVAAPHLTVVG